MKQKKKLYKEIIEIIANINEKYPELAVFIDEMTITIPIETKPKINSNSLSEYKNSLREMVSNYEK